MKKIVNITLCLLLLSFVFIISFTSCEKHEHTFGEWTTALEPTCIAEGRLERVCECGEKETQSIPMIEHEKGEWVITLAPTCTEEGIRERTCVCGAKETETLAKTEHTPSEWKIVVAENVFGKGSKRIACTQCNVTLQTEEIPQFVSQGLAYEVNEDGKTCTITGIGTAHTRYQIGVPAEIDGYKVTAIGDRAFAREETKQSTSFIYIPEGVTYIGEYAFAGNTLSRVSFPNSLTGFADYALDGISYGYTAYDNVGYLGNDENPYLILFNVANKETRTSVDIHKDTKIIVRYAFSNCAKLESIVIPDGVHTIGDNCFWRCDALKEVTIPASVKTIEEKVFYSCDKLEKVNILGEGLEIISDEAFSYCYELSEIDLPNSVKYFGYRAFTGCDKLTKINVPDTVECCSSSAFMGCDALEGNEYGGLLYLGCESNPYVVVLKAKNNMVTSIELHEDTKFVQGAVFKLLEYLKSITVPEHLATVMEDSFFSHCPVLEKVVVPKGTTYLCDGKFYMCTFLQEVILPEGIKEVGQDAFYACKKIKTLTFFDGLETIGIGAFAGCLELKSVYLPGTLTKIDVGAFSGCPALTDIYFDGTKEEWENIEKGERWDAGDTGKYIVHCTDGDIKK